jgi:hypothetical protein
MRNPKTIVLSVIGLAALLLVLRLTVFAPQPDDQKEIAQALQNSIQASKDGRPGGVLDLLSEKFKINEQSPGTFNIAKFIRDNKPDITVANTTAVVSGDTARIDTPVHVKFSYLTQTFDKDIQGVTLVFQKEEAHKYIFFPTTEWHLTNVEVPNDAIPIDIGGDSGFGGM